MKQRRLLVEGGGDRHDLKTECRRGFRRLLEKTGLAGRMPRIVACGGRRAAYDYFSHALVTKGADEELLLLVDSEGPVTGSDPWAHVATREEDQWPRPDGARAEDLHLMVQVMETWFLADREALERYFGKDFRASTLPKRKEVEAIPKPEVLGALHEATRQTKAGPYGKGKHSFHVLAELDPAKVKLASAWARRWFQALEG